MTSLQRLLLLSCLVFLVGCAAAKPKTKKEKEEEFVFCGDDNCFEVLAVERNDTASTVRRAFYKISKKFHPDRNPSAEAKLKFNAASQAYETLGDVDSRAIYEEFLDHPERFFYENDTWTRKHYFGEQESVWVVLSVLLVLATLGEHVYKRNRYASTRMLLCEDPTVQDRVRLLRAARGDVVQPAETAARSRKQSKRKKRVEDLEVTDAELLQVVQVDGFSHPPTWKELLLVRMVFWPAAIAKFVYFRVRWTILFDVLRNQFGTAEKVYLTRTRMDISEQRWNTLPVEERKSHMRHQLWVDESFAEFKSQQPRKRMLRRPRSGDDSDDFDFE